MPQEHMQFCDPTKSATETRTHIHTTDYRICKQYILVDALTHSQHTQKYSTVANAEDSRRGEERGDVWPLKQGIKCLDQ